MRSGRILAQGAAGVLCNCSGSSPQWLSTSADLAAPLATSQTVTVIRRVSDHHSACLFIGWWSCSVAAYGWLINVVSCGLAASAIQACPSNPRTRYTMKANFRSVYNASNNNCCVRYRVGPPLPTSTAFRLAARSLHTSSLRLVTAEITDESATHDVLTVEVSKDNNNSDGSVVYDQERHVENAEELLREMYGPQAKLVVHRLTQRRQYGPPCNITTSSSSAADTAALDGALTEGDPHENPAGKTAMSTTEAAAKAQGAVQKKVNSSLGFYYRASATFRLLGFPVELAVANGRQPQDAIESCLQQALNSDISFIRPSGSSSGSSNSLNHNSNNNDNKNDRNSSNQRYDQDSSAEANTGSPKNCRIRKKGKVKHRHAQNNSNNGFGYPGGDSLFTPRPPRLTPHQLELKAIMDDLRQLCVHFSRSVKFSIKPPFAGPRQKATTQDKDEALVHDGEVEEAGAGKDDVFANKQWRCRCYVKEEWSTIAQARLALEVVGTSPNDVLVRCVTQLRQRYRDELESPAVLEEGVREVAGMVQLQHKTVTATCAAEPSNAASSVFSNQSPSLMPSANASTAGLMEVPTFRAHVNVTDARGNTTTYTVRRQASPYVAYEAAAALALRTEKLWDSETHLLSQGLPTPPLLWRLRWQFDLFLDHVCRETGQRPEEVAWIQLRGEEEEDAQQQQQPASMKRSDGSGSGDNSDVTHSENENSNTAKSRNGNAHTEEGSLSLAPGGVLSEVIVPHLPRRFTGSLYAERDVLVWQTSGGGRYRVEFDTYVQALYHLLDQYGDCLATLPCMERGVSEGLLFPCASVLDLHVHRHDAFPVLQHHRGNINCYALLGTLTAQLLGCPYNTHYHHDTATNEYVCTLTVNDGRATKQPLIQRRSKRKGESWRFACLDAMRENFPRQYAAILDRHPEIDLSADDMARSSHLRSLPREKRIPFFVNLSVMVMALAEEDLGWRQPRVRLRNLANSLGLPQWMAELEAQVEGEEGRRVVAVSASFSQMQVARRSLIYRLAKQYFPEELAVYRSLRRSDIADPEEEAVTQVNKFYIPNAAVNSSMVSHVLALMESRHPTSSPVRFTLEARVKGAAASPSVEANSDDEASESRLRELLDMRYVEGDTMMLSAQDPASLLQPPRIAYTARVLGNRGDVLIADFDSDNATTEADAQAVPVLVTALKSASFHLAGGDAETLWAEYETYPLPATLSARVLAAELFNRFFGSAASRAISVFSTDIIGNGMCSSSSSSNHGSGSESITSFLNQHLTAAVSAGSVGAGSSAGAANDTGDASTVDFDASITVLTTHLGDYWFGTAVLPNLGMLPVARAVATTKAKCVGDALIAAARRSFPRVLQYAVQHDLAAAAIAAEVLTQPIVEQLPPSICRDIMAQLLRKKKSGPLPPFQLLIKCTKETYPHRDRFIRVQQTYDTTHGFQYRLYLQRGRVMRPGDTQLVGYGASAASASAALHRAALMALENLFETALYAAVAVQPDYRDPPSELP